MNVSIRALGGISAYTCFGGELPKLSQFQVNKGNGVRRVLCLQQQTTLNLYSFVIWLSWGLKCSLELDISGTAAATLLNLMTPFLTSMLKGSSAAVIF